MSCTMTSHAKYCHVMSVSFMLVTKMCACHESCVSSRPNGFHVEVKGVQP